MDDNHVISILSTFAGQTAFPIVLAGYLLLRFEKKIDTLSLIIQELVQAIRSEVKKGDQ